MRALLLAAFCAGAAADDDGMEFGREVSAITSSSSCINVMSYSYVYTDDDTLTTTGSCSQAWYYHYEPEDDWGYSASGCFGKANFGCQSCDGSDVPWCEAVRARADIDR